MGKITIHCVRHAQGYHNLNEANHSIPDPDLTPLGETQCATLSKVFPSSFPTGAPKITHLVASPLRRTLYTCLLSFPHEAQRLTITALPELQETSGLPCDTGSEPGKLAAEFGNKVDFSLVHKGWNNKEGRWSPASSAIEARAKDARVWLKKLGEEALAAGNGEDVNIVVVTHGGYLHYFTEDWIGHSTFTGTGWANTEFRSYEFVGNEDSLEETVASRERRRGTETPLSKDEQRELRATAERESIEKGFINGDAKL